MKNKDLQTLEMLRGEFGKSVDSAKVPLKLQKQSIVHMLEKDAEERKVQEEAEAKKRYQVVTIKKLMAIAAALFVTVCGTLVTQTGGPGALIVNMSSREGESGIDSFADYEQIFEITDGNNFAVTEPTTNHVIENPTNGQQPVTPDASKPVVQPTENNPVSNQQPTAPVVTQPVQDNPPDEGEGNHGLIEVPAESEKIEELITNSPEGVSKSEEFEADIVKTHGGYVYILTTGKSKETGENKEIIRVAKIIPGNQMEDVTEIPVSVSKNGGKIEECVELFFFDNTLITISNSTDYSLLEDVYRENVDTVAVFYDISDPANPVKIYSHTQDGEYVSAKICDEKFYIVTSTEVSELTENTDAETLIPVTTIKTGSKESSEKVSAESIFYDKKYVATSTFTYVTVTDISEFTAPIQFAVYGGGKDVFCYADTIVISRRIPGGSTNDMTGAAEDSTCVYRFNVNGDEIRYANLVTEANGVIAGGIYVDEKRGNLRMVTSSNGGYNVYVFNEKMECIDAVEDILAEETVQSVKYIGNRLYLVYGENTSIIDFSKKLSAESIITVPTAISTNLYEVTSSVLLGIGFAGEEKTAVLTLFDFSNPENFTSTDKFELPAEYTFAAGNDGRSIMVDSSGKIFGIPVIRTDAGTNNEVSSYLIFSVENGKITFEDECIHDDAVVGDAAARCICINDTIYTISGNRIVSHSAENYEKISELEF